MHIAVAWYRAIVNDKWQVYKNDTQLFEIEKIIGRSMTRQLQVVFKVMYDEAGKSTRCTVLFGI